MQDIIHCPVEQSDIFGFHFISNSKIKQEEFGQYFTPLEISNYMASMVSLPSNDHIRLLDPGAGGGVLMASLVKHLVNSDAGKIKSFHAVLFEIDEALIPVLKKAMSFLQSWCESKNSTFTFEIKNEDYVLANAGHLNSSLPLLPEEAFDVVISNPPYFKISKEDKRAVACSNLVFGQPNIYALFMGVAISQLSEDGQFVFITPRSFSSGQYFKAFREYFFSLISLKSIHVFASRTDSFDRDAVLQENIISSGVKTCKREPYDIAVFSSEGRRDLDQSTKMIFRSNEIIDSENDDVVCLPANEKDALILEKTRSWNNSLFKIGLKISTGPVVPFRATEFLQKEKEDSSVPLLWIQHVLPMRIKFPLEVFRKQQWFSSVKETKKLLVENKNMILMRRFSPKEDFRRLTVSPYKAGSLEYALIGLENHLNYIYAPDHHFEDNIMFGLSAFLNSHFFDAYFRITNGNTQVSATELKAAKLPDIEIIKSIGDVIIQKEITDHVTIDLIVNDFLDVEGQVH